MDKYTESTIYDYVHGFYTNLISVRKVGFNNAYPASFFVEKMGNIEISVSVHDVYRTIERIRKEKLPLLISGHHGYFIAKNRFEVMKYQLRLKKSVKSLKKEILRIESVKQHLPK